MTMLLQSTPNLLVSSLEMYQREESITSHSRNSKDLLASKENTDPQNLQLSEAKDQTKTESMSIQGIMEQLEEHAMMHFKSKGKSKEKNAKASKNKRSNKGNDPKIDLNIQIDENEFVMVFLVNKGYPLKLNCQKAFDFHIDFKYQETEDSQIENLNNEINKRKSHQNYLNLIHLPDFKANFRQRLDNFQEKNEYNICLKNKNKNSESKASGSEYELLTFIETLKGFDFTKNLVGVEDFPVEVYEDFQHFIQNVLKKKQDFSQHFEIYSSIFDSKNKSKQFSNQIQNFDSEIASLFKNSVLNERVCTIGLLIEFINGTLISSKRLITR